MEKAQCTNSKLLIANFFCMSKDMYQYIKRKIKKSYDNQTFWLKSCLITKVKTKTNWNYCKYALIKKMLWTF